MKTILNIDKDLLNRAKELAERTGRPLHSIVEEGLRLVLGLGAQTPSFRLEDRSVGERYAPDPLNGVAWRARLANIYDEPDAR